MLQNSDMTWRQAGKTNVQVSMLLWGVRVLWVKFLDIQVWWKLDARVDCTGTNTFE